MKEISISRSDFEVMNEEPVFNSLNERIMATTLTTLKSVSSNEVELIGNSFKAGYVSAMRQQCWEGSAIQEKIKQFDSLFSLTIRGIEEHLRTDTINPDYITDALNLLSDKLYSIAE